MNRYLVIRKSDGVQVYDYQTEGDAVEWAGMEFATHDHVLQEPPAAPPPPAVYGGRRILTQLEFLRLFTQPERVAIRLFAQGEAPYQLAVRDFMYLLELAQEVNLDDPETQAGVPQLEALGLIASGRAQEILHG